MTYAIPILLHEKLCAQGVTDFWREYGIYYLDIACFSALLDLTDGKSSAHLFKLLPRERSLVLG